MYDAEGSDKGKEYVEIINLGEDVNLSAYRFVENNKNHRIGAGTHDTTLKKNEIGVLVDKVSEFQKHYPNVNVKVFDSAFSLKNTGTTLEITLSDKKIHSISYKKEDGANGDGNALHVDGKNKITVSAVDIGKVSGIEFNTSPTIVTPSTTAPETKTVVAKTSSTSGTTSRTTNKAPVPDITKRYIKTDKEIYIENYPITFSAIYKNPRREIQLEGMFNFGDGNFATGLEVGHIYNKEGDYIVVFRQDKRWGDTRLEKAIKVLDLNFSVLRLDKNSIKIVNNNNFVLDVSRWELINGNNSFIFENDSLISKKSEIVINFETDDSDIKVISKLGVLLGTFNKKVIEEVNIDAEEKKIETEEINSKSEENSNVLNKEEKEKIVEEKEEVIEKQTKKVYQKREILKQILIWTAILLGIIVITVSPMFFIKEEKRKTKKKNKKTDKKK